MQQDASNTQNIIIINILFQFIMREHSEVQQCTTASILQQVTKAEYWRCFNTVGQVTKSNSLQKSFSNNLQCLVWSLTLSDYGGVVV